MPWEVCLFHVKILNYNSNYMNRCSITSIVVIKIITRYCVLRLKAGIKPLIFWKNVLTKKNDWEFLIDVVDFCLMASQSKSSTNMHRFRDLESVHSCWVIWIVIHTRNNLLWMWPQSVSLRHLHKHEKKHGAFAWLKCEQIMNKFEMYFSANFS